MVDRDAEKQNTMDEPREQQGGRGEKEEKERDEREEEKEERDEEEEWSEIKLAIEELSMMKHGDGDGKLVSSPTPTLPFLALSHLLLQVLDKIGPTMAVLRLDIQRNIERLQELYLVDPSKYSTLMEIVEREVRDGTARKADSCAKAVLWLTRSMDFTIALLQRLEEEDSDELSLAKLVEAAYMGTLKPWHGWVSSAAYKIALKLIPERKTFVDLLVRKGEDRDVLKKGIEKLAPLLQQLLDDIHAMMAKYRLDKLKST